MRLLGVSLGLSALSLSFSLVGVVGVGGALPPTTTVLYAPAVIDGGTLVTFHAKLPDEGNAVTLLRAPWSKDAGVGAWSDDAIVPGFLGRAAFAFDGAHAFVLG